MRVFVRASLTLPVPRHYKKNETTFYEVNSKELPNPTKLLRICIFNIGGDSSKLSSALPALSVGCFSALVNMSARKTWIFSPCRLHEHLLRQHPSGGGVSAVSAAKKMTSQLSAACWHSFGSFGCDRPCVITK